jgi:aryl-alcohol dehydrogenase-like predicted oxidoreductase
VFQIPRDRVVILTKCYFGVTPDNISANIGRVATNDGEMVNRVGLSRKHIFDAVDASVARLGTYIDVLQIHRLDRGTPREEIMRALNDVVESGKVRYIGASSMAAWEFQALQNIADRRGWHKFISMQNYYNLIYREEENEMIPYCNDTGVGLIPWSPLARGALTRPWGQRDTHREKTDNYLKNLIRNRETDVDKMIVDRLEEVSKKMGKSMAQIAMAWCMSKKDVMPIVGLSRIDRMYDEDCCRTVLRYQANLVFCCRDESVAACKIQLSEEDIKYLEEPYQPKFRQGY